MTDQEQQRANHLALVAAPILAHITVHVFELRLGHQKLIDFGSYEKALEMAEALQRAVEERVSNG